MLDSPESQTFGALLRQHRLAAGLTQAALAERSGIAERTIQDLERGAARPRRASLRRLVDALGLLPAARSELESVSSAPRSARTETRASDPGAVSGRCRDNLSIQPTALLGREREVAEVRALLEGGSRLLTLTGPGGSGKTRLAIQIASELLDTFDDGVFLVELAAIMDPALVPSTIAQVLGVRDLGGATLLESVAVYLRARRVLLVLDNFEQIVAAAPVAAALLAASPGLRVLATSLWWSMTVGARDRGCIGSGNTSTARVSNDSAPRSTRRAMATAVNVLPTEATPKRVRSVMGTPLPRSASPKARSKSVTPLDATETTPEKRSPAVSASRCCARCSMSTSRSY